MNKHDFLITILNNLLNDFSDWVRIELRENYGEESCFIFRMDNYNICIFERDFLSDHLKNGLKFNEYLSKHISKQIENTVAKLYVKRLFKEYDY